MNPTQGQIEGQGRVLGLNTPPEILSNSEKRNKNAYKQIFDAFLKNSLLYSGKTPKKKSRCNDIRVVSLLIQVTAVALL